MMFIFLHKLSAGKNAPAFSTRIITTVFIWIVQHTEKWYTQKASSKTRKKSELYTFVTFHTVELWQWKNKEIRTYIDFGVCLKEWNKCENLRTKCIWLFGNVYGRWPGNGIWLGICVGVAPFQFEKYGDRCAFDYNIRLILMFLFNWQKICSILVPLSDVS